MREQAIRKLPATVHDESRPSDFVLYDHAPIGWDVEAIRREPYILEPPLPPCGTEEDILL